MAEKLAAFPALTRKGKGVSKFDKYFDGSVWKLIAGEDFNKISSVRAQLSVLAIKRRQKLRTAVQDGAFIVQMIGDR